MNVVAIVALAALVAVPAFAAGAKTRKVPRYPQGYFQEQRDWRTFRNQYRRDGYLRGPHVFSPSGRYIGSDPSPNVRQRMYDDDLRFRGPLP